MERVLPPGLSAQQFDAAKTALRRTLGDAKVFDTDLDRDTFIDAYALGDGHEHAMSMALAPTTVEEVQAVVRIANEHKLPLWPVSRGKNLGYGMAAPRLAGTAIVDLTRMNRILDVDTRYAYAQLEPGVGFYQLHDHLRSNRIPLWMSVPANGWGAVIGNALERGIGYTPYGDHTTKICGLEVVTPTGEIVRTGMGAMEGNKAWAHYQHGIGPSWDQMFAQSNFGIVTKANMWLMPEPEMMAMVQVNLPKVEDIAWAIDALAELRLRGVIEHNIIFGNYLHDASAFTTRADWYQGEGPIPDDVAEKIQKKFNVGWWTFHLSLFGYGRIVEENMKIVNAALEPRLGYKLDWKPWRRGEPTDPLGPSGGVPIVLPLNVVNWMGGRGGHIGFSPVMPPSGDLALAAFKKRRARFEAAGLDYYSSFTMGHRHICNVNMILYNRDDEAMIKRVKTLFTQMIADAKQEGYGEYRTHIDYMDPVADTYDFNGGMMMRMNERVKDAIDPNGIIAPGKNGIWPARLRQEKKA
ncbi:MAG TPA: FAD-binding oxidoreductase [Sphingomonadaceae bacterium]|nr:FAD-binding oxidoreductase [Sphingomonadaceae bacterium]